MWDWDGIGDDLIGRTIIDIEDRWYSKTWRDLQSRKARFVKLGDGTFGFDHNDESKKQDLKMPVETRSLWCDQSSVSQGKLKMWMEMLTPIEAKKYRMTDIEPPPMESYELRVIVWECKNCENKDTITDMNDLYITGELETIVAEEEDLQQTDLHFRSQDGCGSFNWRMKFPISLPKQRLAEYPRLKLQIWDKDLFSPNDFIAEGVIELRDFLRFCEMESADKRCVLTHSKEEKFWIRVKGPQNGKQQNRFWNIPNDAKIRLSIELMPMKIAKQLPAGYGRDNPNSNPYLPPPEGRPEFNLFNPLKSLRLLLGNKICLKIVTCFCLMGCLSLLYSIAPMLLTSIATNLIMG